MKYTITMRFSCGHEFKMDRGGGVTSPGPDTCVCAACQPWDGLVEQRKICMKCAVEKASGFSMPRDYYTFRISDVKPLNG